jgi:hypothetical protein
MRRISGIALAATGLLSVRSAIVPQTVAIESVRIEQFRWFKRDSKVKCGGSQYHSRREMGEMKARVGSWSVHGDFATYVRAAIVRSLAQRRVWNQCWASQLSIARRP